MKNIPNFPKYTITQNGVIKGIYGSDLKPGINSCGYPTVILRQNGKTHTRGVHRLVLETFVGPRPTGMECRHLNGIKTDNRLENLRWGTHSENILDTVKHGTHNASKLCEEQVRIIFHAYHDGYYTQKDIAAVFGIIQQTVSDIIHKRIWKYIWN